jgi:hypothetical protein
VPATSFPTALTVQRGGRRLGRRGGQRDGQRGGQRGGVPSGGAVSPGPCALVTKRALSKVVEARDCISKISRDLVRLQALTKW